MQFVQILKEALRVTINQEVHLLQEVLIVHTLHLEAAVVVLREALTAHQEVAVALQVVVLEVPGLQAEALVLVPVPEVLDVKMKPF